MRCVKGMTGRVARAVWFARAVRLAASACLMQCLVSDVPAHAGIKRTLHYASNGNFSPNGSYLPGAVGFNLADVSNLAQLKSLPDGVKGLVWVRCQVPEYRPAVHRQREGVWFLFDG
jgi:hypothetical protein